MYKKKKKKNFFIFRSSKNVCLSINSSPLRGRRDDHAADPRVRQRAKRFRTGSVVSQRRVCTSVAAESERTTKKRSFPRVRLRKRISKRNFWNEFRSVRSVRFDRSRLPSPVLLRRCPPNSNRPCRLSAIFRDRGPLGLVIIFIFFAPERTRQRNCTRKYPSACTGESVRFLTRTRNVPTAA